MGLLANSGRIVPLEAGSVATWGPGVSTGQLLSTWGGHLPRSCCPQPPTASPGPDPGLHAYLCRCQGDRPWAPSSSSETPTPAPTPTPKHLKPQQSAHPHQLQTRCLGSSGPAGPNLRVPRPTQNSCWPTAPRLAWYRQLICPVGSVSQGPGTIWAAGQMARAAFTLSPRPSNAGHSMPRWERGHGGSALSS